MFPFCLFTLIAVRHQILLDFAKYEKRQKVQCGKQDGYFISVKCHRQTDRPGVTDACGGGRFCNLVLIL